jgi:hypothetical protein
MHIAPDIIKRPVDKYWCHCVDNLKGSKHNVVKILVASDINIPLIKAYTFEFICINGIHILL